MIRPGMTVRTNDGRKVGHVVAVGREEFEIESGIVFKERFFAPLDCVVSTSDDEVLCKPIELPERDREIPDMPFGSAETPDELENKIEEADFKESLMHDSHHR